MLPEVPFSFKINHYVPSKPFTTNTKEWFEWMMQKIGQLNQRQAGINLLLSLTQRLSVLRSLLHKDKARPCLCIARKVIRDLQE